MKTGFMGLGAMGTGILPRLLNAGHMVKGDVVYTERGHWNGYNNTTDEEVILVWGWSGAGLMESAGDEVSDTDHDSHSHHHD